MTEQLEEERRIYYHGRSWDAPITDGAIEIDERLAPSFMNGTIPCDLCDEPLRLEENILIMPHMGGHLECILSSMLGDVAHLEGRCICDGGPDRSTPEEQAQTYRQRSLAAVQWLVEHDQGRFRE